MLPFFSFLMLADIQQAPAEKYINQKIQLKIRNLFIDVNITVLTYFIVYDSLRIIPRSTSN
jgi:hypothetical protein